ncbi:MAG TPA: hypothetical protein VFG04_23610 [Planctomycetaceae bacterium]|jgi:hypothetical protein|nr:hypothetical protein [Planctomycetaceae bacterium]
MGTEIVCEAKYKRASYRVKLHLDRQTLTLRDELKLSIPLKDIQAVAAKDDQLTVKWNNNTVVLHVGSKAERLAKNILNPPSLLDRLGIKADYSVSILGLDDPSFVKELRQRTDAVSEESVKPKSDIIFLRARQRPDLAKLKTLRRSLKSNGAIWVLWKKGMKGPEDVKESEVMAAGKAHGLVDVKIASFSDELSALKFVIPVADRLS